MRPEDNGKEVGISENWGGCWVWIFPGVIGVVIWVFALIGLKACFFGG